MRFVRSIFLVLCLGLTLRADDDVKWGAPVNGLRIGIVNPPASATSDQELTFKIVVENVSKAPITLPTPDTFMLKGNPQSDDYHESPLSPMVSKSRIGGSPTEPIFEWNFSTSGIQTDLIPKTVITVTPDKSVTWNSIPLEKYFYSGDRLPPGNKTTVQRWTLPPNFIYHIQFRFENQAKQLEGQNLWIGKADSGIADVPVKAPNTDDFKLQGGFALAKPSYFIGEPIETAFTVTNNGTDVIGFATGGRYMSSGRDGRYSFSATDEQGHPVLDPTPDGFESGGLGSDIQINPGATYIDKLLINKWCAFSKPGKYTILCKRTLNIIRSKRPGPHYYSKPEDSLPIVPIITTLTLTLVDDPAAQATLITSQVDLLLEKNPGDNGVYHGLASEHLKSLAQAKAPAAFPEIIRLLDGTDEVQLQAAVWLSYYGYEKAAPVLLEHAAKLSPRARSQALRILSEWNAPGIEPLVAAALRDSDPELRANTVLLCSNRWYASCVPILLTMETDLDPRVRENLGRALGVSGDPKAIPVLTMLLHDSEPYPSIKISAAAGLGKFKQYEGVPVVIDLLKDPKTPDAEQGYALAVLIQLTGQKFENNRTGNTFEDTRSACLDWWEKTGKAQYGKGS